MFEFKNMCNTYWKELQKSTSNLYAMYSKFSCRISKQHTHTIFEERWDTKLKSTSNFVKGLPHLCPCHQPNPQRVSNVHKVNKSRTQLLSMS